VIDFTFESPALFHIALLSSPPLRSIETFATLFDKDNNKVMTFKTRQHGHRADGTNPGWPDFGTLLTWKMAFPHFPCLAQATTMKASISSQQTEILSLASSNWT
jgi:hypothetical protein